MLRASGVKGCKRHVGQKGSFRTKVLWCKTLRCKLVNGFWCKSIGGAKGSGVKSGWCKKTSGVNGFW